MSEVLQAEQLTVRRGSEVLFQALNFVLQPGQMTWLRGSNGSGKTSLLRVVAGLAQADSGRLLWGGVPLSQAEGYREKLCYLGHANGLKDDLSAMESLQFLTALHGRHYRPERLQAALGHMGVAHRRTLPTRWLSQGQRRRVALARLVLETAPGLWVLDEPFDALDDAGVACVQQLLVDHVQRGGSVLFTSHIPVQPAGVALQTLQLQGKSKATSPAL